VTRAGSATSGSEVDSTLTLTVGWFIGSVLPADSLVLCLYDRGISRIDQAERGPVIRVLTAESILCAPKTTGNATMPAQITTNRVAALIRVTTGDGFGLAVSETLAKHDATDANRTTMTAISANIFNHGGNPTPPHVYSYAL